MFRKLHKTKLNLSIHVLFQEAVRECERRVVTPEDADDLSPMPTHITTSKTRRGAISAEPLSEDDATSYVKKVRYHSIFVLFVSYCFEG